MSKQTTLNIKVFYVKEVKQGNHYTFKENSLTIPFDNKIPHEFEQVTITIIKPGNHQIKINNIMDIIPISTKVLGQLGQGITHTLIGVYVLMTGRIKNGEQMHSFGASDGILANQLKYGKYGTPEKNDYLIQIDLIAKEGATLDRGLCQKMYAYVDQVIQPIRERLKVTNGIFADESHTYKTKNNENKPKVTLVKQVAGQGAMYDNLLFPAEPSGYAGGFSIIEMNNMPVLLTANEYRDGAIRAMV